MDCAHWRSRAKLLNTVARKKRSFDMRKEVRKLARERVGTVPAGGPILPKRERKKPKHKRPISSEEDGPE